jgi:hypothetical protein
MAREPNDIVVRILREIQKTQAEHSADLEKLEVGQQEIRGSIVTAPWLSAHANVRLESHEA